MSKKKNRQAERLIVPPASRRRKYLTLATTGLMVALCLGAVLGPWSDSLGARRMRSLLVASPPPPVPPPGSPSKEYIYAGGKLLATEEPMALAAPINLMANSLSSSQVDVSWAASSGADHYQVERSPSMTAAYTVVAANVTGTSFTDTSVSAVATYLYRVRAVGSSGNASAPSNSDMATAITFADDPLTAGSTPVKAQHLTELRLAVNAVRAAANLSAATWTDSSPAGVTIKAIHIQELRTNLDQALNALGVSLAQYTDSSLSGITVKKIHTEEIRQRVK